MSFRRWFFGYRKRRNSTHRCPLLSRRRISTLQALEDRQLLAVLTNGFGRGQVTIDVNEQGAFGTSSFLSVSNPSIPAGNQTGRASFNAMGVPSAPLQSASASLSGAQQVPPVSTTTSGTASLQFNASSGTFDIDLALIGIWQQEVLAAQIRLGAPGTEGPVLVDLGDGSSFTQDPNGVRLRLQNVPAPTDALAEIAAGNAYLEIRTTAFPSGELRGQITAGPAPTDAVYESGVAIRLLTPGASREFLTAGTIGDSGGNINGAFLDNQASFNTGSRTSRFYWPNSVPRLSTPLATPPGAALAFDLQQNLVDLRSSTGGVDGTALVQTYRVTNVSSSTLDFELVRYFDGDLFYGGTTPTPFDDGGGAGVFDPTRSTVTVFQTDQATDGAIADPTFIGVQTTAIGALSGESWEVGVAGDVSGFPSKPVGDLLSRILAGQPLRNDVTPASADIDLENSIRDSGEGDDVALAQSKTFLDVDPGETVVFTTITIFGHPPLTFTPPGPPLATVEGVKFLDDNGNGVFDPGESGASGFTIFADLNQNGVLDGDEPFTISGSGGFYSLTVPVGTHQIREVVSSSFIQTFPAAGFHTTPILFPGQLVSNINFGNRSNTGSLSGFKFEDVDGDGRFDLTEQGVVGVTIYLDLDNDGALDPGEPQQVTGSLGDYLFADVPAGAYVVREVVPAGTRQTVPGGDGAHRVSVSAGQFLEGLNFGNQDLPGSISGSVWNDLNRNGVFDASEFALGQVSIYLDEDFDGVFDPQERSTSTNAQGFYTFANVPTGLYHVREIVPADFVQTSPPGGFFPVHVSPGFTAADLNFGNVRGEIRGVKFQDDNGDGIQGPSEFGVSNVTIYLDRNDDGVLDPTEPQTLTDSSGGYVFQNLPTGNHVVREVLPPGFIQTTPGGDGARRVQLSQGEIVAGQNFGNQPLSPLTGSLSGLVFEDRNGNQLFDLGEAGLPRMNVYLDLNNNNIHDPSEPLTQTDLLGDYAFSGLSPGTYIVRQSLPLGFNQTVPLGGAGRTVEVFAGSDTALVDFGDFADFDFGDAPASYGVLRADDGARHALGSGLRLGALVDSEADGSPGLDALNDDRGPYVATNLPQGGDATLVTAADVNGDGWFDLVGTRRRSLGGGSSVDEGVVRLGNGDGTFQAVVPFDLPFGDLLPNPIAIFPIDLDPLNPTPNGVDLIVAHESDTLISVLINNGDGTYGGTSLTFDTGVEQSDVAAFDYDGDGDVDIFVTRPLLNDVLVLRNDSVGFPPFFQPPPMPGPPFASFPVGVSPQALADGDFNDDGRRDLAVVNRDSGSVTILLGDGVGGFSSTSELLTPGAQPVDLAVADLDQDGDLDLAVIDPATAQVATLLNDGNGGFALGPATTLASAPAAIAAGLFNEDEFVDLAVTLTFDDSVVLLLNNGDNTFTTGPSFATGFLPVSVVAAPFDGDSLSDVATANLGSFPSFEGSLTVLNSAGADDEDGVRISSNPAAPGSQVSVTVSASGAGFVNAWIDFNRDGDFGDSGERVLTDAAVIAGENTFSVSIPGGASPGATYARFRLSSETGLGPLGAALSGEVEDHVLHINAAAPYTNASQPADVNGDGSVGIQDLLLLANDLRNNGSRALPGTPTPPPPPFLDVDGNGLVSINDLLLVVQFMLSQVSAAEPEGEGEAPSESVVAQNSTSAEATGVLLVMPGAPAESRSRHGEQEPLPAQAWFHDKAIVEAHGPTATETAALASAGSPPELRRGAENFANELDDEALDRIAADICSLK